jgi:hypothetical protein
MAVQPMIVATDTWIGVPNAFGSTFIKRSTTMTINTANAQMVADYGGLGNLVAAAPTGDGESSDRSFQAN